jgi:hypothetical protein
MTYKQTQEKPGHLRGTAPNTKGDSTGRSAGNDGQPRPGFPHKMDKGKQDRGGSGIPVQPERSWEKGGDEGGGQSVRRANNGPGRRPKLDRPTPEGT